MSNKIFISYRRDGGDVTAKLICEALKNKGYSVFYDYDSLKGGVFDVRLLDAIDECTDVVLVLPKNALARCKHENDWVRQEIRHALKMKKNIIPVMMEKFEFPKKLPPDIQDVARYNGVRFRMDFFENVIEKIIENLSSSTRADSFATSAEPAPVKLTDNVSYRIYLHVGQGMSSDVIIYSPDSSAGDTAKHDFSEDKWEKFSELIRKVVSAMVGADEKRVAVSKKSALGIKECAPCDGMYFDEQYRIRFAVNYLLEKEPDKFQHIHFDFSADEVSLTLFDQGDYVFKSVPDDTPLSYFGIDESALVRATEELISFAEPKSQVMVASHFENNVYSDKSGGYRLKYLKMG